MLYQLKSGKTIRLTEEQFFKMTDAELHELEADDHGYQVEDPFYDSCLEDKEVTLDDFELPEDIEDIPEGFLPPEE